MTINANQKKKIIADTISAMKKAMPDDVIGLYNDIGSDVNVETISTGSLAVDAVIGGGFAKGRMIDLVGHTSSGKTTLALTACATLQKENPDANILYVDAEAALDPGYAAALGVNMDKIILCQPSCGENGFKTVEMFIESGVADLAVIDSVAAMIPKSMLERDYSSEAQPGQFAKLISTAIPRINRLASAHKCTVILINQWKPVVKMNQYAAVPGAMGNWYQPGGAQLPFWCSQILEIKKSSELKVGKTVTSNVITMTCKKNKIAPPHRTADFVITYGKGLDKKQELICLGILYNEIKVAGAFYSMPNYTDQRFQGRNKLGAFLDANPDICEKLENTIKDYIKAARDISLKETTTVDESESDTFDDADNSYNDVDDNLLLNLANDN